MDIIGHLPRLALAAISVPREEMAYFVLAAIPPAVMLYSLRSDYRKSILTTLAILAGIIGVYGTSVTAYFSLYMAIAGFLGQTSGLGSGFLIFAAGFLYGATMVCSSFWQFGRLDVEQTFGKRDEAVSASVAFSMFVFTGLFLDMAWRPVGQEIT